METCRVNKKEVPIVSTKEATIQLEKGFKNNSHAYHIYGLNGHKMTDYPNFAKMQKMFQGENASSLEVKLIVEVKTINVDVNVVIRSKIIKD